MAEAEAGKARRTLLIVDDEVRILSALQRCLRREGYEILIAASGADALELLAQHPVDLILSDQMMPEMDGLEFLDRARRICPDSARLLITGWREAVSEDAIAMLDILALIPKPWDDAELKATLRGALGRRSQSGARGSTVCEGIRSQRSGSSLRQR